MMKRIVTVLFFSILFLFAAILVVPSLIDWNKYRDQLIARLEKDSDVKFDVKGDLKLGLLPNLHVSIENVTLHKQDMPKDPFVSMQTFELSASLLELVNEQKLALHITFDKPNFNIFIDQDGRSNWPARKKKEKKEDKSSNIKDALDITLVEGSFRYADVRKGMDVTLEDINIKTHIDGFSKTVKGLFDLEGSVSYKGAPSKVKLNISGFGPETTWSFNFDLASNGETLPRVTLAGKFEDYVGKENFEAEILIENGRLLELLPMDEFSYLPFLKDRLNATATLKARPGAFELSNLKATFGKGQVEGDVKFGTRQGFKPLLTTTLTASDLKLFDKRGYYPVPEKFDIDVTLKGKNIQWNDVSFEGARARVTSTEQSTWQIDAARFDVAGKTTIEFTGGVDPNASKATGTLKVQADDISALVTSMPFKALKYDGKFRLQTGEMQFADFTAVIEDKNEISGTITVPANGAEKFTADVDLTGNAFGAKALKLQGQVDGDVLRASVQAEKIDFDVWPYDKKSVLDIKTDKAFWRGNDFTGVSVKLDTTAAPKASAIKAKLWDGNVEADIAGKNLKSSIKNADLDELRKLMDIEGITLGKGSLDIDVSDNDDTKTMFGALAGKVEMTSESLTIEKFNVTAIKNLLSQFKTPPENLKDLVVKALGSASTKFKDVKTSFIIKDGHITFEDIALDNADVALKVKGDYDLSPKTITLGADVTPKGALPAFTLYAPGPDIDVSAFADKIIQDNPVVVPEPIVIKAPEEPIATSPEDTGQEAQEGRTLDDVINGLGDAQAEPSVPDLQAPLPEVEVVPVTPPAGVPEEILTPDEILPVE